MVSSNYGLSTERPHRSLLGLDYNNQSDSSSLHSIDLFREGVTQHGIYIYIAVVNVVAVKVQLSVADISFH